MNRHFKQFLISTVIYEFYVWTSLAVPFLVHYDLTLDQAFAILSIYSFAIVILEYPTGVIGDYFGHKASVLLGHFCMSVGYAILLFFHSYWYFALGMVVYALGQSLRSGSDVALLKTIDQVNFKKNLKFLRFFETFIGFFGAIAGGLLVSAGWFDAGVATMVFTGIVSGLLLLGIPDNPDYKIDETNPYALALNALKFAFSKKEIFMIIAIGALLRGYLGISKNVVSAFGEIDHLDATLVGVLVALTLLARSMAYFFYDYFDKKKVLLLVVVTIAMIGVAYILSDLLVLAAAIILGNVVIILIFHYYELYLNDLVPDNKRASVLSLLNLLRRGLSSALNLGAGFLLVSERIVYFHIALIALFIIFGVSLLRIKDYRGKTA